MLYEKTPLSRPLVVKDVGGIPLGIPGCSGLMIQSPHAWTAYAFPVVIDQVRDPGRRGARTTFKVAKRVLALACTGTLAMAMAMAILRCMQAQAQTEGPLERQVPPCAFQPGQFTAVLLRISV